MYRLSVMEEVMVSDFTSPNSALLLVVSQTFGPRLVPETHAMDPLGYVRYAWILFKSFYSKEPPTTDSLTDVHFDPRRVALHGSQQADLDVINPCATDFWGLGISITHCSTRNQKKSWGESN